MQYYESDEPQEDIGIPCPFCEHPWHGWKCYYMINATKSPVSKRVQCKCFCSAPMDTPSRDWPVHPDFKAVTL